MYVCLLGSPTSSLPARVIDPRLADPFTGSKGNRKRHKVWRSLYECHKCHKCGTICGASIKEMGSFWFYSIEVKLGLSNFCVTHMGMVKFFF